jgi:cell division protein FtsB
MTFKEAIDKIKVMLEENQAETVEQVDAPSNELKFETYDLKDGSKIDLSALEVGADAMLVDESGNGSPAPSGEYELADGTMVSVMDGKVEGIETPEAESPMVEEEMGTEEVNKFETMNATIEYLQAENEALKSKVESLEGKFKEGFANVAEALEKLSNIPSAEPAQEPKAKFALVESKDSKINRYLELVKNLK